MPIKSRLKHALALKVSNLTVSTGKHAKQCEDLLSVADDLLTRNSMGMRAHKHQSRVILTIDRSDSLVELDSSGPLVRTKALSGEYEVHESRLSRQHRVYKRKPQSESSREDNPIRSPITQKSYSAPESCNALTTSNTNDATVSSGSSTATSGSTASVHTPEQPTATITEDELESARLKRRFVLEELYETEKQYVEHLGIIVNVMMEELTKTELPPGLLGKEKIIFGNIRAIYGFHKNKFLPDIEVSKDNSQELGTLFLKYQKQLKLYINYCENKPRSEYIVTEHSELFQELIAATNQRLSMQDLMIKPVQRIMKYHLLLKDILKYTERCLESTDTLVKAIDLMKAIPKAANNMMEVGRLQGFDVKLSTHGTILLQDNLPVAEVPIQKAERKYKTRRVFLFEQLIIFSDVCTNSTTGHYYKYRSSIKLRDLSLMEKVFNDDLAFILSNASDSSFDMYIQFPDQVTKSEWSTAISKMLNQQRNFLIVLEDPLMHQRTEKEFSRSCPDLYDQAVSTLPTELQAKITMTSLDVNDTDAMNNKYSNGDKITSFLSQCKNKIFHT